MEFKETYTANSFTPSNMSFGAQSTYSMSLALHLLSVIHQQKRIASKTKNIAQMAFAFIKSLLGLHRMCEQHSHTFHWHEQTIGNLLVHVGV